MLFARLSPESSSRYEHLYASDLQESVEALCSDDAESRMDGSTNALKLLLAECSEQCRAYADYSYRTICNRLQAETSTRRRLARETGMWPRLSAISPLQRLAGMKGVALREH